MESGFDPGEVTALAGKRGYDLILLEFDQPGTPVRDLIVALRRSSPQSGIVLIADRSQAEKVLGLFPLGLKDVLIHPFNPAKVMARIRELLAEAMEGRTRPQGEGPDPAERSGGTQARSALPSAWVPRHLVGASAGHRQLLSEVWGARGEANGVILKGENGCEFELVMRELVAMGGDLESFPLVLAPVEISEEHLASLAAMNRLQDGHPHTVYIPNVEMLSDAKRRAILHHLGQRRKGLGGSRQLNLIFSFCENSRFADETGLLFHEELQFYVHRVIEIPPLRKRLEDIPALARRILFDLTALHRVIKVRTIERTALEYLMTRTWPGNHDEFVAVLRQAIYSCPGKCLQTDHLEPFLSAEQNGPPPGDGPAVDDHWAALSFP